MKCEIANQYKSIISSLCRPPLENGKIFMFVEEFLSTKISKIPT
jgi:hypothetical protein